MVYRNSSTLYQEQTLEITVESLLVGILSKAKNESNLFGTDESTSSKM